MPRAKASYTAVGTRVPRLDGPAHVTGKTQFAADLALPGMAWGALLRSRRPHARIVSVNTAKAARMPGVLAVLTAEDGPGLVGDVVRYRGEAIAAVAAETRAQARAAARAIEVVYRDLPVVTDVRTAIAPHAPQVHEGAERDGLYNVCDFATVVRGDVKRGFAAADHVFENTFETPWVHQGYIEPHATVASWESAAKKLTVWTSTQAQFSVRSSVANALGLPQSRVRVVGMAVGGGFGGKGGALLEPITAALSRRVGRPVKLVMTREEEFLANHPCGGAVVSLKSGVKKDGTLVAFEARVLFDTGAYGGAQTGIGAELTTGPYRTPNVRVKAYAIYTNKPSAGARRALTAPHVHFAVESQMDIIAHALGLDPVAFRLKNVMKKGDPVAGGTLPYSLPGKVMRAAAERAGWGKRPKAEGRGRLARGFGFAAGHWTVSAGPSAASVHVNEDGTLSVLTGAINLSGTDTSFAQIAAERFGVPGSRVSVTQGDTDTAPYNAGSWHSRVTFGVGEAVRRAAEEAAKRVAEAFAEQTGAAPKQVQIADGHVQAPGTRAVPLGEVAGRSMWSFGPIVGHAELTDLPFGISSSAQVAEVEVDRDTGQWRLLRLVCAQDVGFAINPLSVEGQIQGGASHGIGYALSEEYLYEEGRLLNPDFMDFRLPTSLDHPEYDIVMIEDRLDGGPYGAKGVGEPPTIPTAPAIANAIFDAVGARVKQLPLTPERVWRELQARRGQSPNCPVMS